MTEEKRTLLIIDDYIEPAVDIEHERELLGKWAARTDRALRALGVPGKYLKPIGKANEATAKASMEWLKRNVGRLVDRGEL